MQNKKAEQKMSRRKIVGGPLDIWFCGDGDLGMGYVRVGGCWGRYGDGYWGRGSVDMALL